MRPSKLTSVAIITLMSQNNPSILAFQIDPFPSFNHVRHLVHKQKQLPPKTRRYITSGKGQTTGHEIFPATTSQHFLANSTQDNAEVNLHCENCADTDSYTMLLQKFMEEYAQEALDELQVMNSRSYVTTQHSSNTAAVVVSAPIDMEQSLTLRVNDETVSTPRDEGALWRARMLLVGAAALYGTNFSLVKLLGDTMPVGISTTLRFGLATLATLPWLFDSKFFSKENDHTAAWLGLEVGMWNSIGYVAQAVGLETTLASKSAFICSMAVVIVPLLEFMTGKKLLARQWVGALMALVGVAFLELGGGSGVADALASLTTGDALSLIQPLMFGIGFWKMEKAMQKFPAEAQRLTAAQVLAVFLGSAAYGLWSLGDAANLAGEPLSLATVANAYPWKEWMTDPSILFSLFWTGCITTALTIYMETMALETLSATETTLIFSTEPLWGTAFAATVMGEQLGMNAGVGAFFILSACLYSNLGLDGLGSAWKSGKAWLKKSVSASSALSRWSQRDQWAWLPSSIATSFATWNVATSNLAPQELNEIVDDLVDKLS